MRVNIETKETALGGGLIKKGRPYCDVCTTIRFSEEELAIIRLRKLDDIVIMKRDMPHHITKSTDIDREPGHYDLKISHLLSSHERNQSTDWIVFNPYEAQQYIERLTEALKDTKAAIMLNAEIPKPVSFEL